MDTLARVAVTVNKKGDVTIERDGDSDAIVVLASTAITKTLEDNFKDLSKDEQTDALTDNIQAIIQTMIHILRDDGYVVPGLPDIALINEAYDYFENAGKPIDITEARRITDAVMDNDSIWEEMHGLMQDIHEEV